jgi:Protein phosphatase 2C
MEATILNEDDAPAASSPSGTGNWQFAAAQQCGSSHEATGGVCEDAYSVRMPTPDLLVIAVADGAGSAQHAQAGATAASERGAAQLCARLESAGATMDDLTLEEILREAMGAALEAVQGEAVLRQVSDRELATTLILVIAHREFIAATQIGDGAAVLADASGEILSLTVPTPGEYINEVVFLTSADAIQTAQVKIRRGRANRVAVFTDGLQMLGLEWPEFVPHEPFFTPLFDFIAGATDEVRATKELETFLSSEKIAALTDDDQTLVLAALRNKDHGNNEG